MWFGVAQWMPHTILHYDIRIDKVFENEITCCWLYNLNVKAWIATVIN